VLFTNCCFFRSDQPSYSDHIYASITDLQPAVPQPVAPNQEKPENESDDDVGSGNEPNQQPQSNLDECDDDDYYSDVYSSDNSRVDGHISSGEDYINLEKIEDNDNKDGASSQGKSSSGCSVNTAASSRTILGSDSEYGLPVGVPLFVALASSRFLANLRNKKKRGGFFNSKQQSSPPHNVYKAQFPQMITTMKNIPNENSDSDNNKEKLLMVPGDTSMVSITPKRLSNRTLSSLQENGVPSDMSMIREDSKDEIPVAPHAHTQNKTASTKGKRFVTIFHGNNNRSKI